MSNETIITSVIEIARAACPPVEGEVRITWPDADIKTARAVLAELLAVKKPAWSSHAEAFQEWCEQVCWTLGSDEEWTVDEKIDAYLSSDDLLRRERIGVTEGGSWGIAHNGFYIEVDAMTFVEAAIYELTPHELFGEDFFEDDID